MIIATFKNNTIITFLFITISTYTANVRMQYAFFIFIDTLVLIWMMNYYDNII